MKYWKKKSPNFDAFLSSDNVMFLALVWTVFYLPDVVLEIYVMIFSDAKVVLVECRDVGEILSTIRFGQRVKSIRNDPVINEISEDDVNDLSDQIRQLKVLILPPEAAFSI